MKLHHKLISWLIWLIGFVSISGIHYLHESDCLRSNPVKFLLFALISSTPFMFLAWRSKCAYENERLTCVHKNKKISGLLGAFVLVYIFALWSFSSPMDEAFTRAGAFWLLAYGPMIIGYVIGRGIYVLYVKRGNREMKPVSKLPK